MRFKLPTPESWVNNRGWGFLDKMKDGNFHPGFDLNSPEGGNSDLGLPIVACADGVIECAKDAGRGFGNHIFIRHNMDGHIVYSHYAHLQVIQVRVDDKVSIGQQIGLCGYSGRWRGNMWTAHLHWEIRSPIGRGHNFWPAGKSKAWIKKYYFDPVKFVKEHSTEDVNDDMKKEDCFKQCFITVAGRWPDNDEVKEWKKSNNEIYTYVQNNVTSPITRKLEKEITGLRTRLKTSQGKTAECKEEMGNWIKDFVELENKFEELEKELLQVKATEGAWVETVATLEKKLKKSYDKIVQLEKGKEVRPEMNTVTKEALKELGRVFLFALLPFLFAQLSKLPPTPTTAIGFAVLKTVDKFIHLIGKETGNEKLLTGLSRF